MIYVTSDLHGYPLDKFKKLLEKANFSDEDYCFVLGDVIDRGPESVELLKWLMMQPNIELIMGNHEAMFLACTFLFDTITEEALDNLTEEDMAAFNTWVANGGSETLNSISGCDREDILEIIDYVREAPLYDSVRVNNKDFLLVHSGLGEFDPNKDMSDYSADELIWTRPDLTQKYFDDMITIFGHTPTLFYGEKYRGKAVVTDTWIDIDTGAACGGSPMLLRLDDMKEFYV
jgi:serine/threonine protein phosphatase 1